MHAGAEKDEELKEQLGQKQRRNKMLGMQ